MIVGSYFSSSREPSFVAGVIFRVVFANDPNLNSSFYSFCKDPNVFGEYFEEVVARENFILSLCILVGKFFLSGFLALDESKDVLSILGFWTFDELDELLECGIDCLSLLKKKVWVCNLISFRGKGQMGGKSFLFKLFKGIVSLVAGE